MSFPTRPDSTAEAATTTDAAHIIGNKPAAKPAASWPTIRAKLWFGLGTLIFLTLLVTGLNYLNSAQAVTTISRVNQIDVPSTIALTSARANLLQMRANIQGYLLLGDPAFREDYRTAQAAFERDLERLAHFAPNWSNPRAIQSLTALQQDFLTWQDLPEQMFALRDNRMENEPARRIVAQEAEPLISDVDLFTTAMLRDQMRRPPTPLNYSVLRDIFSFRGTFASMVASLRGYQATNDAVFKEEYQRNERRNDAAWGRLVSGRDLLTSGQQELLDNLSAVRPAFIALTPSIFDALEGDRFREDLYIFRNEAVPLSNRMLQMMEETVVSKQRLLTTGLNEGSQGLSTAQAQALFIGFLALAGGIPLALWLGNSILQPIRQLTAAANRVANGQLETRAHVRTNDELGTLARMFNYMTKSLQRSQHQLANANRTLELKVQQRTAELARAVSEAEHARLTAEEARRTAEQANYTKSAFLANMSHELRTPLNAIIGYSEMLEEESEESEHDATMRSDLRNIRTAGQHLLELITGILDISKIEAGRMQLHLETFDLSSLLDDVVTTVLPLVQKNDNVLKVHAEHTITMHADTLRIRQILFNVLSNAAKFTHDGTITFAIKPQRRAKQDGVLFRVSDTGIGITPDQISQLFQPFTQADDSTTRRYGGTGLGLTITQHFCHAMGGSIEAASEPGVGSTFLIWLPATVELQTPPIAAVHGPEPPLP